MSIITFAILSDVNNLYFHIKTNTSCMYYVYVFAKLNKKHPKNKQEANTLCCMRLWLRKQTRI